MCHRVFRPLCLIFAVVTAALLFAPTGHSKEKLQVGYALLRPDPLGHVPVGTALFSYRNPDGILVAEAAVPAVSPIREGRIYVDQDGTATGIAFANPFDEMITATLTLRDSSGVVVDQTSISLGPKEHLPRFVDQIFEDVPDSFTGSLSFRTDDPGELLATVTLRQGKNSNGEALLATLPVGDTSGIAATPTENNSLVFPHIGAGTVPGLTLTTQIILMNASSQDIRGEIRLTASDGNPLVASLDGVKGSEFSYELAPDGVFRATLTSSEGIAQGFARVTFGDGQAAPIGTAVFQFRDDRGRLISETGVGAIPATTAARIFVDTVGTQTGVAITNPSNSEAVVHLDLLDRNGLLFDSTQQRIPAGGHVSVFANGPGSLFEALPLGFTGLLEISSDQDFIPISLKLTRNERSEAILTTLPVADLNQPPPTGLKVFPQVGFGLGFSTRLILINTDREKPSPGRLEFRSSDGASLDVPMQGAVASEFDYEVLPGAGLQLRPGNGATAADIIVVSSDFPSGEVVLNVGSEIHLRPLVIDTQNQLRDDFELAFRSVDSEIAPVDQFGRITGLRKGFSTLTVSTSGVVETVTVTVAEVLDGTSAIVISGITQDLAGRLYLSSAEDHAVLQSENLNTTPTIYAGIQGSPGLKNDTRLSSLFDHPVFLALNQKDGGLYVSDSANNVIRKIQPGAKGRVETIAGSARPGHQDGPGFTAAFNTPLGLVLDGKGYLWVSDSGNHTIRRINLVHGLVETVAGSPGEAGFADGAGSAALFNSPAGLALESESPAQQLLRESRGEPPLPVRVVVADSGNGAVRLVTEDGTVTTLNLPSPSAQAASSGHWPLASAFARTARVPRDVVVDPVGNIFVSDISTGQVLSILANGTITLAAEPGTFDRPGGMAISRAGRLLVTDGNRIGREVVYGQPEIEAIEPGAIGILGGGQVTISGRNFSPETLVVVGGTVIEDAWIQDSRTILIEAPPLPSGLTTLTLQSRGGIAQRELLAEPVPLSELSIGEITTIAGGTTYIGDGRTATSARITAGAMTLDARGNFYFADPHSNRIRRVDAATGIITSIAGNGLDAAVECQYGSVECDQGDDGLAITAMLATPYGVAIDPSGSIWIADSGADLIRRVDRSTGIITTVAGVGFSFGSYGDGGPAVLAELDFPLDIEIAGDGNIFIADGGFSGRVRRIDSSGIIDSVAGGGEEFVEAGLALDTKISFLSDTKIDPQGNLLFVDSFNHRVRNVDLSTGLVKTVAGSGCDFFQDPEACNGDDGVPALEASLGYPAGVDVDSEGNIYIGDGTRRVRLVEEASGNIYTVAGNGGSGATGDGGPAEEAEIGRPESVTVDGGGNIYFSDTEHRLVRRVDGSTGILSTFAGSIAEQSGGDQGPALAALFTTPKGLGIDPAGNFYVADTFHHRIRRIDAATGIISTVAGAISSFGGFSGDGGLAVNAELYRPSDVAIDTVGNLYIAADNRVRRVDLQTGVIDTVAGNGDFDYSGDGGPAVDAGMDPTYLAVDRDGNLYLSDSYNDRIRRVDAATGIVTTIAGNGGTEFSGDGGPATQASLNWPEGLAVDGQQRLFVADRFHGRVRVIDLETGIIDTVAGGPSFLACDGCYATDCSLAPTSVAVDNRGNLFITEDYSLRIRKVDLETGLITTVAGHGASGFAGDGGPATAARMRKATDLATDSSGNVFFVDSTNDRIRAIRGPLPRENLPLVGPYAGSGNEGYSGDGGPAATAYLNQPQGLAVDASGNLYIADSRNHRIRKVDKTGKITTFAGTGEGGFSGDGGPATMAALYFPSDVALDNVGNLFVVDSDRVRKVRISTGIITTVAGNDENISSGDGGPAVLAGFWYPRALAIDRKNNVYVSDALAHNVRRIDAASGIITTVAGGGGPGFGGDGGPATEAELNSPEGLAVDSDGNLFIADELNDRIRRVDAVTGIISSVAGSDFRYGRHGDGDGGPAVDAYLYTPTGIAFDNLGNLLIAEGRRVRRLNVEDGTISTIAGRSGVDGDSGDGGPATAATLDAANSVAVDSLGNVYIADSQNNRIRVVRPPN